MRVEVDTSSHSFNKKVRHAVTSKIPNILILGAKEQEQGTVTLRRYCVKEQLTITRQEFLSRMLAVVKKRVMDNFADEVIPL
jgi:threonyl-tRNA synthetase